MQRPLLRKDHRSRNVCRICFAVSLVAWSVSAQDSLIRQAERLFEHRANLLWVREAISVLVRATESDHDGYDAEWRLAKYYNFLGKHETEKRERRTAFEKGIEAAKRAISLEPGRPEGHFWLAVNYGEYGRHRNFWKRWRLAKPLRRELEAVIRIDRYHENGSAYAVLGKWYSEVPGLLGGSLSRGIEYLEKAVEIGPDNSLAKLFLAESDLKAGRREEAERWLRSILTQAPDRGYEFEFTENQRAAHRLLKKYFKDRDD